MYIHCSKHLRETVFTLGVAIPATDLTIINSVTSMILFEKVKIKDRNG